MPTPFLPHSPISSSSSLSSLLSIDRYESDKKILLNDDQIRSKTEAHKYSAVSVNIRSLNRNIDQLRSIMSKIQPDFVLLSEIFNPHEGFVASKNYHKIEMNTYLSVLG